jgi:hypothetical protein
MSDKKAWMHFEKIDKLPNDKYSLLSSLIQNLLSRESGSVLFTTIKSAIRYFAAESEAFRNYFNDNINETADCIKLVVLVDNFQAYTPEDNILKYEILNLLFITSTADFIPDCNDLKRRIDELGDNFIKLHSSEKSAHISTLLRESFNYRHLPGKGKGPLEMFFAVVFCHVFNNSQIFKVSTIKLINENMGLGCRAHEIISNSLICDKYGNPFWADNTYYEEMKARLGQLDEDMYGYIIITIDTFDDMYKGALTVSFEPKSFLVPLKLGECDEPISNNKMDGYFWLSCMSQKRFNELKINLLGRGVVGSEKINHVSWVDGKESILELLKKSCQLSKDEYEKVYLKYFINLIESISTRLDTIIGVKDEGMFDKIWKK